MGNVCCQDVLDDVCLTGHNAVEQCTQPGQFAAQTCQECYDRFADLTNRQNIHADASVHHYLYGLRTKAHGGLRVIEAPKSGLKALQRQILRGILDHVPVHDASYGFVKWRSAPDAAAFHCGAPVVVKFDFQDFFPRITYGRVMGYYRRLGYRDAVARNLAGLCTTVTPLRVRDYLPYAQRQIMLAPHLPQGAPTSPALANALAFKLDRRLSGLARSLDARYTRYADDMTFSGEKRIIAVLLKVVPEIVRSEGFMLNPRKTHVMGQGGQQKVTGIVVNKKPNLARKDYDQIKAVIHALRNPNDPRRGDIGFRKHIEGRIGWVKRINPGRGEKLCQLYNTVIMYAG